jgi:hypothetical protein
MKNGYKTRRQTSKRIGPEPRLFGGIRPQVLIYGSAIRISPKQPKINEI